MRTIKIISYQISILIILFISNACNAQKAPTFMDGEDPKPNDKKWKLVKNMSDEFDGKKIDETKWQISGQGWIGRSPGLFLAENIKIKKGSLQITTTMLPKPVIKNNEKFTHGGGYVGSRNAMKYGYYECEMKANKTFMSSTFWFINNRNDGTYCDKRVTELDIQECVGQITGTGNSTFDETIHSNSHSRNASCSSTVEGSAGNNTSLGGKAWADYYVYGAWWKSATEIEIYLNGVKVYTINPVEKFNLPSLSIRFCNTA